MLVISKWVQRHFKWLRQQYAFREKVLDPNTVLFLGPKVCMKVTYNPQDGCGFYVFHRDDKELCFGISMLIAAIRTYRGQYQEPQDIEDLSDDITMEREIEKAALFLKNEGKSTLTGDMNLFRELSKLRFWHIGRYVQEWGKGIVMSEDAIAENRRLVPRIIELLNKPTKDDTNRR